MSALSRLALLFSAIAYLSGIGKPSAGGRTLVADATGRTLTFTERVGYQYAIEQVYWNHRTWPKDNPGLKPPLDRVISRAQVENKVSDYLRASQALADCRQRPIAAPQLQAEMDRMAQHTKQAEVLRELFAALGNNPFVIAECLARPILAERLIRECKRGSSAPSLDGIRNREAITTAWLPPSGTIARGSLYPPGTTYRLPKISALLDCTDDTWTATTIVNAPVARWGHTTVWTGVEMIVWGGLNFSEDELNTGASYNPATDSWTATSITNVPLSRWLHTAVWTGSEMIVWGGYNDPAGDLNGGGRYNPIANIWVATSTTNAPAARVYHTAAWTGSEMIVWGGSGCSGNCQWNTGGRYDPATDSWIATSTTNAPVARFSHSAVWTGSEMIVWGGADGIVNHTYLHTGGRYNPATDSWIPMGLTNVPPGRVSHTAVWTGGEMIVWGGEDESFNFSNTGGRYDPSTDNWTATSLNSAPSPRSSHSAVWTGNEMIVWSGYHYPPAENLNTGGKYSPKDDSWTPTGTFNVPLGREWNTAVWSGSEMLVWGGYNIDTPNGALNSGGTYCAQAPTPVLQDAISRKTHGFAGLFDIPLPLNGTPGVECRSGGVTNDHSILVRFTANVTVSGNPQAAVTSGVGTIGSGGNSNGGTVLVADNLVTIPLTNVANAQTVQVTLYGVNGSTNFVIPMSILIGDTNGNSTVNASDVSEAKSRLGQQINATNFRSDVNANGYIDAADVALVKSSVGTGIR